MYCFIEPGLLVLDGLASHEVGTAQLVINALLLHRHRLENTQVEIPITANLYDDIFQRFSRIQIQIPPIAREFKELVLEILGQLNPKVLCATGIQDVDISPDFQSNWIDDPVRRHGGECLLAAIYELYSDCDPCVEVRCLAIATWSRQDIPTAVTLSSNELMLCLHSTKSDWQLPVLSSDRDWITYLAHQKPWPDGIVELIEEFGQSSFGFIDSEVSFHLKLTFESQCWQDLAFEKDPLVRSHVVKALAYQAYNRQESPYKVESIKGGKTAGGRRLHVRPKPPVRFHYYQDGDELHFTMYSCNDHDKGL